MTLYELLGVKPDATPAQIKKAYRRLAKKYHPDVNPTGEAMFKLVDDAYHILDTPHLRREYDGHLLYDSLKIVMESTRASVKYSDEWFEANIRQSIAEGFWPSWRDAGGARQID